MSIVEIIDENNRLTRIDFWPNKSPEDYDQVIQTHTKSYLGWCDEQNKYMNHICNMSTMPTTAGNEPDILLNKTLVRLVGHPQNIDERILMIQHGVIDPYTGTMCILIRGKDYSVSGQPLDPEFVKETQKEFKEMMNDYI